MDISQRILLLLELVCILFILHTSAGEFSKWNYDCIVRDYILLELGYVYIPRLDYISTCVPCTPKGACYLYNGKACVMNDLVKMSAFAYAYLPLKLEMKDITTNTTHSDYNFRLAKNYSAEYATPAYWEGHTLYIPIPEILFIGMSQTSIRYFSFLKYQGLLPRTDSILADLTHLYKIGEKPTLLAKTVYFWSSQPTGCKYYISRKSSKVYHLGNKYTLALAQNFGGVMYTDRGRAPEGVLGVVTSFFRFFTDLRDKVIRYFNYVYDFFSRIILVFSLLYLSVVNSTPILLLLYIVFIKAFGLSTVTLVAPVVILVSYYFYYSVDRVVH